MNFIAVIFNENTGEYDRFRCEAEDHMSAWRKMQPHPDSSLQLVDIEVAK